MKKINLFLWGIVSTCITFFYRTEICAADDLQYGQTARTKGAALDTCDGYVSNIPQGSTQLYNKYTYNNPMRTLCDSDEIFLGCTTGSGATMRTYLVSNETMETMAMKCFNGSGICHTGCPSPGSKQTSPGPTHMRTKVCINFCSHENPVNGTNFGGKYYLMDWCAIPFNNGTAFANINSRSNTCAINAGETFEDDTGSGEYTNKCYYTE